MTGPRPPDDGPHWPEQDLPSEGEGEQPSSWLDAGSSFDAEEPGNPPDEPPTDQRSDRWWEMPWDRADDAAPDSGAEQEDEWPAFEPPPWTVPPVGPPSLEPEAAEPEQPAEPEPEMGQPFEPAESVEESGAVLPPPAYGLEEAFDGGHRPDEPWPPPPPEPPVEVEPQGDYRAPEAWPPSEEPSPQETVPEVDEPPTMVPPAYEPPVDEPPADEPPVEVEPQGDYRAPEAWPPSEESSLQPIVPEADEPSVDEPPPIDEPPTMVPPAYPPPVDEPPGDEPPEEEPPPESVAVDAAATTTSFTASDGWDPDLDGERRRPTTAEQAVPWMIGVILALAGLMIVLLALIFTFPGGLAGSASPTPAPSLASLQPSAVASDPAGSVSSAEPSATPVPTPDVTPPPQYGPLEMVYLGRPSALAPIYLLRRDFAVEAEAKVMAQADQGITAYAWAPDGTVGAAIIAGRAVALTPGESARAFVDDVDAISFGWDAATLYAVRITTSGGTDSAEVVGIDFASADTTTLATVSYPHPTTGPESKLKEAQFIDDGGSVRLFAAADGNLDLWVLGAPATYRIDPASGEVTNVSGQPLLYAPDGRRRIALTENSDGTTILRLLEPGDNEIASTTVTGLVSHIRWAGTGNEIVFTLGTLGTSGGVRQDLYVWDLSDGGTPMPLTSNGISFGARWVGVMPNWIPPPS